MKKAVFMTLALLAQLVWGNDGVYFVSGNQLVPVRETDISITSEVLTISIGDDGFARVDVQYEFNNHGQARDVEMGFEAYAPYNVDNTTLSKDGRHPFIRDFTVVMNGQPLTCRNAVIDASEGQTGFRPLDLSQWRVFEDAANNLEYIHKADSILPYAYAYCFKAPFKEGVNTVHHTYRYRMSYGVGRTFEIDYWLTPALRWENGRIDDFTMRIKAENTAKHFCMSDTLFTAAPFRIEGTGKMRTIQHPYDGQYIEVSLRNATLEWHTRDFVPRDNITIYAADILYAFSEKPVLGSFYDRGEGFHLWGFDEQQADRRILRNLPYAHRGYVFRDKRLREYFSQLWWYMPDERWKASTADFTPGDWRVVGKMRENK